MKTQDFCYFSRTLS